MPPPPRSTQHFQHDGLGDVVLQDASEEDVLLVVGEPQLGGLPAGAVVEFEEVFVCVGRRAGKGGREGGREGGLVM